MIRVGITGGIGSGKSTICRVWEEMGAYVIHADELAKEIMVNDPKIVKAIKKVFGEQAYFSDGSLNRSWLAEQAFGNDRIIELNQIVHPAVYKASDELMQDAEKLGHPVVVREAAILLQYGRPSDLNKIVLVLADRDKRQDWVKLRDDLTLEHIRNRLDVQPAYEEYIPHADIVIHNDGTLNDLENKARQTYIALTTI
jgi:dephospho-CoA kinase